MGLFDGVWMNVHNRQRVVSHLVSQVPSAHALMVFPVGLSLLHTNGTYILNFFVVVYLNNILSKQSEWIIYVSSSSSELL